MAKPVFSQGSGRRGCSLGREGQGLVVGVRKQLWNVAQGTGTL